MSLVNDMLRDLDKRERQPHQAQRINNAFRSADRPARRSNPALIVTFTALSVLIGLGAGFVLFDRTAPPVTPAVQPELPVAAQDMEGQVVAVEEAPAIATPAQPPVTLSLSDEDSRSDGFTLRLSANDRVQYRVAERTATSLTLEIEGVANVARHDLDIPGLGLVQSDNRVELEYSGDIQTVFQVQEDADTSEFDILLTATWRQSPPAAPTVAQSLAPVNDPSSSLTSPQSAIGTDAGAAQTQQGVAPGVEPTQPALSTPSVADTAPANIVPGDVSQIRTTRELSLDQRDAMLSQQAITMVQSGRLVEAYQALLEFVAANPQAHLSRETLATVLVAQNEYVQAATVVEEGLRLVPNYAPYKKVKARLLMQEARNSEALALLVNLPPLVSDDPEYHELLATLSQQVGRYDQAIATYQELLRRDSSQGRWWAGMAISLEAQGKATEAVASYQAALQTVNLDPSLRQYAQSKIRALSTEQ